MTLFESLKLFPKVDLHIDLFGSIPKDTIYELTKNSITREEIDDIVEFLWDRLFLMHFHLNLSVVTSLETTTITNQFSTH